MTLNPTSPNHALQRTPGFGVQFTSAAVVRPAQSRAVLPATKPGTSRAFALRRRAHSRARCSAWLAVAVEWGIDDARQQEYGASVMEAIAEKLENKLHEWKPETSQKVRALVAEIIEQADDDALDIGRSRSVEQEVMDILDEPSTR